MTKIKTILFDFGGVVITLNQQQAICRYKEIGLKDADRWLDAYTQTGIFGDLEIGKIDAEQFRKELSAMAGCEITGEQCLYAWKGYVGELPRRNLEALRRLRGEGYRLVLLSNTNPYMMSWARSSEFDGEGHSLDYYFDTVYTSYECGFMKPDEHFFRHVIAMEGIGTDEMLFLDDGPRNIEAAAHLGIHTLCTENGADWTGEIYKYLAE